MGLKIRLKTILCTWRKPKCALSWRLLISSMLVLISLASLAVSSFAATASSDAKNGAQTNTTAKVIFLKIDRGIGPAVQAYVEQGLQQAQQMSAKAVLLQINTPGGLVSSTRGIVQAILASKVPVISYVAPSGSRAASAGTFIVYASAFAAMAPGTHLGAATPVSIGGGQQPGETPPADEKTKSNKPDKASDENIKQNKKTDANKSAAKSSASAMRQKVTNDSVAFIRSLAQLHGRNVDFAEQSVINAATLTADEALKQKVINAVAQDRDSLIKQAQGATLLVDGKKMVFKIGNYHWQKYVASWKIRFLQVITDPAVAYFLLIAGAYGLFLEFTNPGVLVPGVIGGISLLLGLYAMQLLPINYTGLSLMALGIGLMIGEAFIPQIGIMGIGGVIAFAVGSFMLIDTQHPAFMLASWVIISLSVISAAFFILIGRLAMRSRKQPIVSGVTTLVGEVAQVQSLNDAVDSEDNLYVFLQSEKWHLKCKQQLKVGDQVRVTAVESVFLEVEKVK